MTNNLRSFSTRFWIQLSTALALSVAFGCVSVNIPRPSQEKAKVELGFSPPSPFRKKAVDGLSADSVWMNADNGNSISYLTQCGDDADPTLESLRHEVLVGLSDVTVVSQDKFSFNAREALRSQVRGLVDGVETQMDVVVFKKNRCIYTLALTGVGTRMAQDRSTFQRFLDGFKAP